MAFSEHETALLLKAKFIGPTVVRRLEEAGFGSFSVLGEADVETVCAQVAARLGASCWKNSPQSRQAVANAIAVAKGEA
ncbi:MAG: helix-hairpin-helix domain-containing protein [Pseudomonadota bacterium]